MNSLLSEEEKAFLEKYEQQKKKHRASQQAYRLQHQEQIKEYNRKYFEDRKRKLDEINMKILKSNPIPTYIDVEEISRPVKIDKRTKKGKKQALNKDIVPSYQTRQVPLGETSIKDYISKANKINIIFKNRKLPQPVQAELKKLFNDNPSLNLDLILSEMDYLNDDIKTTIDKLRDHYPNDNTFKAYTNILSVISSHFKELHHIYQPLTKVGKLVNKKVQDRRELNELDEGDEGKIICLNPDDIYKNLDKLKNIEERLIYALYTLFPARRLDYKNMKLTTETNVDMLDDINYLILSNPKLFVFNDYKTNNTYGKQVFKVPDDLDMVINQYLTAKKLRNGDFLFSLMRDKKEPIAESNFSAKVKEVFKKVYGIPISMRFVRMSWATDLYASNPTQTKVKEITFKMSHSPAESALYKKIIKKIT
jgi:hypothetical protein